MPQMVTRKGHLPLAAAIRVANEDVVRAFGSDDKTQPVTLSFSTNAAAMDAAVMAVSDKGLSTAEKGRGILDHLQSRLADLQSELGDKVSKACVRNDFGIQVTVSLATWNGYLEWARRNRSSRLHSGDFMVGAVPLRPAEEAAATAEKLVAA